MPKDASLDPQGRQVLRPGEQHRHVLGRLAYGYDVLVVALGFS